MKNRFSLNPSVCYECGAVWVDGQSCEDIFHTCLGREFTDSAYGAVHHLTVPAYYLQHPSLLSRRGWEEMRYTLAGFLVDGISVGQMRQQAKISLDSGRRDFSFRKGERMDLAGIVWSVTIANIRLDDAEIYRADVQRWAQAVLDDLDSLLLAHNPRFIQLLEEARQRVRVTGGVSLADFRRRLEEQSEVDD